MRLLFFHQVLRLNQGLDHILGSSSWWQDANHSKAWQEGIFYGLGAAYSTISLWAIVQLLRIERRVPEYGWTIQKLFHLLNFLVHAVRAVVFFLWRRILSLPLIVRSILLDFPGLIFFTTYTLLILFWAQIYNQARTIPADKFRRVFIAVNVSMYVIQALLWFLSLWIPTVAMRIILTVFFSGISLVAAIGFLLYGGRLFLMLQRFPIESKGRQRKLREVGAATAICTICFVIRSFLVDFSAINRSSRLDVMDHPLVNLIYYLLVEILPSALVLFILRKLPPKRAQPLLHFSLDAGSSP